MSSAALTRLARRTARGGGWRNLLIVGMIALAVASAVVAAIAARSAQPRPATVATAEMGAADVEIEFWDGLSFADLEPEQRAFVRSAGRAPTADPIDAVAWTRDRIGELAPDAALLEVREQHVAGVRVVATDVSSPLERGRWWHPTGLSDGDVLVSEPLLADRGLSIGDRLDVEGLPRATVVGTVDVPPTGGYRGYGKQERVAVFPTSALLPDPSRESQTVSFLIGFAGQTDDARQFVADLSQAERELYEERCSEGGRDCGLSLNIHERAWLLDPDFLGPSDLSSDPTFIGTVVGAVLLVQVALVAAAAFATGARRRIRELGLLGAGGATPQQIRGLVLREAAVLGSLGGAGGAALGVALSYPARPLLEMVMSSRFVGISVHPLDVAAPAVLGAVAAVAAAYLPARTVARVPAATALAGRVPLGRVPTWVAPAALATSTLGLALLSVVIRSEAVRGDRRGALVAAGVVLTVMGAASLAVPIVGLLGRLADRVSASARLVVRDAARQRTRSAAAIGALTVVLTLPVFALVSIATDAAGAPPEVPTDRIAVAGPYFQDLVLPATEQDVEVVVDALPTGVEQSTDLTVVGLELPPESDAFAGRIFLTTEGGEPTTSAGCRAGYGCTLDLDPLNTRVGVATSRALDLLGIAGATAAVERGDVLHLVRGGDRRVGQRRADVELKGVRQGGPEDEGFREVFEQTVAVTTVETDVDAHLVPELLIPASMASGLPLVETGSVTLLRLERALDSAESTALDPLPVNLQVSGRYVRDPVTPALITVGASLLVALAISAMTATLAATESDRDLRLITAVGAEPNIRRRFHGLQAGFHAATAAVVAVPAGVLLAAATLERGTDGIWLDVPWLWLLGLAVLAPALLAGAHRMLTRSSPVSAPRRIA